MINPDLLAWTTIVSIIVIAAFLLWVYYVFRPAIDLSGEKSGEKR